jgi:hypothetical protein
LLKIRLFLRQNSSLYRADLKTDAAVNAGGKVDPVPVGTLGVFAGAFVDAGNGASLNAVGNPFTDVRNNGVGHSLSSIADRSTERINGAPTEHIEPEAGLACPARGHLSR